MSGGSISISASVASSAQSSTTTATLAIFSLKSRGSFLSALATSEIPVLAIAGEHDRGTPPAAARRIAATAPRGELVVLDGVGHFPFAEAPDAYWGAVRGWLDRTR